MRRDERERERESFEVNNEKRKRKKEASLISNSLVVGTTQIKIKSMLKLESTTIKQHV